MGAPAPLLTAQSSLLSVLTTHWERALLPAQLFVLTVCTATVRFPWAALPQA